MGSMENIERTQSRYQVMWSHLDEKGGRLWAASEANAHGRGGLKLLHETTGMSGNVIVAGIKEFGLDTYKIVPGLSNLTG